MDNFRLIEVLPIVEGWEYLSYFLKVQIGNLVYLGGGGGGVLEEE